MLREKIGGGSVLKIFWKVIEEGKNNLLSNMDVGRGIHFYAFSLPKYAVLIENYLEAGNISV